MKRIALLLGVLFIVGFIMLFVPFYKVFSFTETRMNNPKMYYINVSKDESFQILYTHSIHLTDVIETYEATESSKLKLVSMQYEDVAVGMPAHAEEGQTLIYEDGTYKLTYSDTILEEFTLYIGDIDLDLQLRYDGEVYNLKENLKRGHSYLFRVQIISLYDKLRGVLMTHEDE